MTTRLSWTLTRRLETAPHNRTLSLLAILHNARAHLPHLESLLMDVQPLLDHRSLWGDEGRQYFAAVLPRLTESEHAVYQGLKQQQWGTNVRLEQERIAWDYVWPQILTRCGPGKVTA